MPSPSDGPLRPPRTALVTGGARRIGRAIVLALARAGYRVAIHVNHSHPDGEALRDDISRAGGRAAVVAGDLADHDAVLGLVPAAVAAVGPLCLLVNNAAEFEPDDVGRLDRARFDRHFAVNLRAPLFLAESFSAQVPDGSQASIVNVLDQRVFNPNPHYLTYGLTKSALHAATTTLAQALAPHVRVNAIAPGAALPNVRQDPGTFSRSVASLPLGRGPTLEEIADAVLYLASAQSVTGQTIVLDGGQHLAWNDGAAAEE